LAGDLLLVKNTQKFWPGVGIEGMPGI